MIIGLGGHPGAGKDTVAAVLVTERGFHRIAFADPLRDILLRVNPVVAYGVTVAQVLSVQSWDEAKRERPAVRRLLQELGEAIRAADPHFLENILVRRIWEANQEHPGRNWVIPDVRTLGEMRVVRSLGGRLWHVARPGTAEPCSDHPLERVPETGWEQYITNSGSKTDLRRDVLDLHDCLQDGVLR